MQATSRFPVLQVYRTGLDVTRRKALTIIALAVVSIFLAAQAVSGIDTLAGVLGLPFPPGIEPVLVFLGSLPLMFFAVVPLASQAIRIPRATDAGGRFFERLWRDATMPYRTLSLRIFLRCLGLFLISNAVIAPPYVLLGFATLYLDDPNEFLVPLLLNLGALAGLAVVLWVLLRWLVALPAMILERLSIREGLSRSWQLTTSRFWGLFRLAMLTGTVVTALSLLLGIILRLVFAWTSESGNGDRGPFPLAFFLGQLVSLLFSVPVATACYHHLLGQHLGGKPNETS